MGCRVRSTRATGAAAAATYPGAVPAAPVYGQPAYGNQNQGYQAGFQDGVNDGANDELLPLDRLRVKVLRIVVYSESMLGTLDFQQSSLGSYLFDVHPRTLDRNKSIPGAVHDQGRRDDLCDL